jgi:Mg2+/Co2+ transporter CorC
MDELKPLGVQVSDEEAAETLGAVVLERLARLPRRGDKVTLGVGATAEVMSLSRRRVTSLRVVVARPPEDSSPE